MIILIVPISNSGIIRNIYGIRCADCTLINTDLDQWVLLFAYADYCMKYILYIYCIVFSGWTERHAAAADVPHVRASVCPFRRLPHGGGAVPRPSAGTTTWSTAGTTTHTPPGRLGPTSRAWDTAARTHTVQQSQSHSPAGGATTAARRSVVDAWFVVEPISWNPVKFFNYIFNALISAVFFQMSLAPLEKCIHNIIPGTVVFLHFLNWLPKWQIIMRRRCANREIGTTDTIMVKKSLQSRSFTYKVPVLHTKSQFYIQSHGFTWKVMVLHAKSWFYMKSLGLHRISTIAATEYCVIVLICSSSGVMHGCTKQLSATLSWLNKHHFSVLPRNHD